MDLVDFSEFYAHRRFSRIPNDNPDDNIYPLYKFAKRIELTLQEGDAVFIPAGWFHFVFSEEVGSTLKLNTAVNFFIKHNGCIDCSDKNVDYPKDLVTKRNVRPEDIAQHQKTSTPFVHRHFQKEHPWKCFGWTRATLTEKMGDRALLINVSKDRMFASNWLYF